MIQKENTLSFCAIKCRLFDKEIHKPTTAIAHLFFLKMFFIEFYAFRRDWRTF